MKSIHGLILAIGLGILAAGFNFIYLYKKSQVADLEYFIGVPDGRVITPGDRITNDMIEAVGIPLNSVGNLKDYAFLWKERETVVGEAVWRTIPERSLLLRDAIKTPAQELTLGPNEAAIGVPVDTRTFPPSLIEPGDLVSFIVSHSRAGMPTAAIPQDLVAPFGPSGEDDPTTVVDEATEEDPDAPATPKTAGPTETIGMFKVLSLGNRLGKPDVMKSAGIPQLQQNVMTIAVEVDKAGKLVDPKDQKLIDMLYATNFRQVGILLHSRKKPTD